MVPHMPSAPRDLRSLKIAFFVGVFPVVSETFIVRQITALRASGHKVDIFADTPGTSGAPLDAEAGALIERVIYMDMPLEIAPFEMPVSPIFGRTWPPGSSTSVWNLARIARAFPKFARCLATSPRLALRMLSKDEYGYRAQSLSQVYRMARLAEKSGNYDVLHAHFGPVAESFRFARALWRAPFIVSFHGYDFTTVPRKEGKNLYRKLFATADAVTGSSAFSLQRLSELGCPEEKLRRLPMGLDPTQFSFRKRTLVAGEPIRILLVARLTPIKGVSFAIDAICELQKRYANVQLDIVGDGPSRVELEQHVRELRLGKSVRFHGALAANDIQRLIDHAHIFLHLSIAIDGDQEGQGLVLQEAQAAGLPVVATRHGAFPEGVIEGKSALLVPERDARAAADALHHLVENPQIWPEMGQAGRALVETNYDIRILNEQLLSLYHQLIAEFRP
jgi:colanic acid/amylovoran biosynthesis glycosyltransferase